MTQELMDLKTSIIEGRYADALLIVDELEGMSKQAILRNIKAFLKILLIHLIKNQVEQRLTGSWACSIRNAVLEIQGLNLKGNKTSYYINNDEWDGLIESVLMAAVAQPARSAYRGCFGRSLEWEIKSCSTHGKNRAITNYLNGSSTSQFDL